MNEAKTLTSRTGYLKTDPTAIKAKDTGETIGVRTTIVSENEGKKQYHNVEIWIDTEKNGKITQGKIDGLLKFKAGTNITFFGYIFPVTDAENNPIKNKNNEQCFGINAIGGWKFNSEEKQNI